MRKKVSPIAKLAIKLIRRYQTEISPRLGARCRYYPTCSQYGIDAIKHYGFFIGGLKTTWRILRCNPWSKGGYDPAVPEADEKCVCNLDH